MDGIVQICRFAVSLLKKIEKKVRWKTCNTRDMRSVNILFYICLHQKQHECQSIIFASKNMVERTGYMLIN